MNDIDIDPILVSNKCPIGKNVSSISFIMWIILMTTKLPFGSVYLT